MSKIPRENHSSLGGIPSNHTSVSDQLERLEEKYSLEHRSMIEEKNSCIGSKTPEDILPDDSVLFITRHTDNNAL